MELTLTHHNVLNTEFVAPNGQVIYRTETPKKLLSRKPTKLTRGTGEELGTIDYHNIKDDEIVIQGRRITMTKSNVFSESVYCYQLIYVR